MNPERRAECEALDAGDPLAPLRTRFALPSDRIYLDGNSLGVPTHTAIEAVRSATEAEWAGELIGAWNDADWIGLPRRLGDRIGRLLGAAPGQTLVTDSISVNLVKLLAVALALNAPRTTIVSATENFPTDLYMARGLEAWLGRERCTLRTLPLDAITPEAMAEIVDDEVAVVMLTQVDFRTGRLLDLPEITRAVHAQGALVLWDLAHSAGALPLQLDTVGVDLAVGCGYKFLGGGPGAPAFVYVAERHHNQVSQPLQGWMGHDAPFDFDPHYTPARGVQQFLSGTPPILSARALEGALDVFDEVDIAGLHAKSMALSEMFISLVRESRLGDELELASPPDPLRRGSQIAFRHSDAWAIMQAGIEAGVVGDFRAPDLMRFGIAPLYLRFVDMFDAVARLEEVVIHGRYRLAPRSNLPRVT